jgi:hypothetical protein
MADRIKYKKKYKESVTPLGIGDPLLGAGLNAGGGRSARSKLAYQKSRTKSRVERSKAQDEYDYEMSEAAREMGRMGDSLTGSMASSIKSRAERKDYSKAGGGVLSKKGPPKRKKIKKVSLKKKRAY